MEHTQSTPPAAGKAAHTPTPWATEETQATLWIGTPKRDKLDYVVAGIAVNGLKPDALDLVRANAAFIVTACNSHAALVEALEKQQDRLCQLSDSARTEDDIRAFLVASFTENRAALALAKGGA